MNEQNLIIGFLVAVLLIAILMPFSPGYNKTEGFGAKFKITGRKNKCACCRNCEILYARCRDQSGSYSPGFCERERWACKKSCRMSDYGS